MKLKFNYDVPDKYTKEEYKAGQVKDFTKERAEEILKVINKATGKPYAEVVKEKPKNKKGKVVIEDASEVIIDGVNEIPEDAEVVEEVVINVPEENIKNVIEESAE